MAQEPRIDVALTALKEGQVEPTKAELAEIADSLKPGVWFANDLSGERSRDADVVWELTGAPYKGQTATGQAAVYYANPKIGLRKPFLFADGFSYGPSDLPGLFAYFNTVADGRPGLFDELLSRGYDIVLIGFTERHTHIQANAGVVIDAILRAIVERVGDERLTVGGVSMGGIVTRYALAKLETQRMDHQTSTYLSFDSPHNGAWIPLILQQMAYFFEDFTPAGPDGAKQADLIRSAAAQQLLWAWVENSKYSGPVATASPLRKEFLDDLARVGNFPQIPRKLGISNGRRDGVGLPLPVGEVAFDWQALVASATARFQPDKGEKQRIGGMHLGLAVRRSATTEVPGLDAVPGGTLDSFGKVADALKAKISDDYRSGAFVPAVSAAALDFDPAKWDVDPAAPITDDALDRGHLDEVTFDEANSEHGHLSRALVDWIVGQLAH
ncbi:lipase family alpha/beta hydrolase [Kitasatospora sp. NPDC057904]|uniref:lipase family alpha/beta hydrolase n=1 Tax=unclassified Kitasatospora TaxID=2633591 RepID=UPI0036D86922